MVKNFSGFRRDFRVEMRGTSSSDDKLADDLGNAIEGTRISGRKADTGEGTPGEGRLARADQKFATETARLVGYLSPR